MLKAGVPAKVVSERLGHSSIATRRVVPALERLPRWGRIDLATRQGGDPTVQREWTHGTVFGDYSQALATSESGSWIVSTVMAP